HGREIDHETAFTNRLPGNAVTSAANRKKKIVLARKTDTGDDISRSDPACNEGWPPVDHGVRNSSDSVIALLSRAEGLAPKRFPELLYDGFRNHADLLATPPGFPGTLSTSCRSKRNRCAA